MQQVTPEPIRTAHHTPVHPHPHQPQPHPAHPHMHQARGTTTAAARAPLVQAPAPQIRPADVNTLIANIQQEFPNAHIRITGRGRTIQRQAELMAQRRRHNRDQFIRTYLPAQHISEMDAWVHDHPQATEQETTAAFVDIINQAQRRGAVVSNHLTDRARDISIPMGNQHTQQQIRQRLQQLGGHVIDERDAIGGPHWHVDY